MPSTCGSSSIAPILSPSTPGPALQSTGLRRPCRCSSGTQAPCAGRCSQRQCQRDSQAPCSKGHVTPGDAQAPQYRPQALGTVLRMRRQRTAHLQLPVERIPLLYVVLHLQRLLQLVHLGNLRGASSTRSISSGMEQKMQHCVMARSRFCNAAHCELTACTAAKPGPCCMSGRQAVC